MDINLDAKVLKEKFEGLIDVARKRHVDVKWIALMALFAITMIVTPLWLKVQDLSGRSAAENALSDGRHAVEQLAAVASALQATLDDTQVHQLALLALNEPDRIEDLKQHLSGLNPDIKEVKLYPSDLEAFDPVSEGVNGFAVLDMLLTAASGLNPPLQIHSILQPPMLMDATALSSDQGIEGYLVINVRLEYLLAHFKADGMGAKYMVLSQNNGRQAPTVLDRLGQEGSADRFTEKLSVNGTLFRIELPQVLHTEFLSGFILSVAVVLGLLMLAVAVFLFQKAKQWKLEHAQEQEDLRFAAMAKAEQRELVPEEVKVVALSKSQVQTVAVSTETPLPEPPLPPPPMQLRYDINQRRIDRSSELNPVELTAGIFRAYDIRGIVGKSLDAGVARLVGRVLGSMALEKSAGPVVVARDGRLSGPALVAGMIEGIRSTGCDVMDIGAVPTGVLYFAAHELAAGTGVMITGSHNPPDYNGFKVMVAGDTLFGEQISDIYRRIVAEEFLQGEGGLEELDVLRQYRERIASDIKLARPLRVVIDCGNGIGGVCAADVLRDIGAEALPLFDEVDGDFPNHHPDPSDPKNLIDLIEAVRMMDADLGLALDGDADRLGVVTRNGSIIYPDRIMMLLAMDVLDRVPGATIIYDVKCTGHLAKVIEEAGGKAVMYKTGHSLIKARMKEIGSPFAGEMSGHFFFGERWYGVDDGIYAAARLLEILAAIEASPEDVLDALPTSFSTPELKVEMDEGENHAFIDAFQAKARFEDAKVTTIDGVRADYADGWGLVRASNTTPILVVRFDGESEEALERIKNIFRARMLAVNPDLELPF